MLEIIKEAAYHKILDSMSKRKTYSRYWVRFMKLGLGLYLMNASSPDQDHNIIYTIYKVRSKWEAFNLTNNVTTTGFKTRKDAANYAMDMVR